MTEPVYVVRSCTRGAPVVEVPGRHRAAHVSGLTLEETSIGSGGRAMLERLAATWTARASECVRRWGRFSTAGVLMVAAEEVPCD